LAYKTEIIKEYNSYGTNLTPRDVVLAFPGNVLSYLSKSEFYLCDYTVCQGEHEQNYAWHFKIIKDSFKWGTVYILRLVISNGVFEVQTSTSDFKTGDKSAERYYWTFESVRQGIREFIVREFKSFVQESLITMKMHSRNYDRESQEALAYVCSEFLPELLINQKADREAKRKTYREAEREAESKTELEAYRRAYLQAMLGGWD
jgi:hypothetical protein